VYFIGNLDAAETERIIHRLIDKLPPRCRQIFLLSRIEQLSYKEIAALMDLSPKTVENQIAIALKFLRDSLYSGKGGGSLNRDTINRYLY
jgi:RNA polymerase sigma-70 factor, ECF subfamily